MKIFAVTQEIQIDAKPEEVWDALTNPEKTKKYFFKSKVFSNWTVGSKIAFKGKLFFIIPFEMHGTILEIEPLKLLKYNLGNARSASISTVTDTLAYANGVTTLSVHDDVGQGEGAEKRYKKSNEGWEKILKGLKKLVESHKKSR